MAKLTLAILALCFFQFSYGGIVGNIIQRTTQTTTNTAGQVVEYDFSKYSPESAKIYLKTLAVTNEDDFIDLTTRVIKHGSTTIVEARGLLGSIQNAFAKLLGKAVEAISGAVGAITGQTKYVPFANIDEAEAYLLHLLRTDRSEFVKVLSHVLRNLDSSKARFMIDRVESHLVFKPVPVVPTEEEDIDESEVPKKVREWFLNYVRSHKDDFVKMAIRVLDSKNYYEVYGMIESMKNLLVKDAVIAGNKIGKLTWTLKEIKDVAEFEHFLVNLLNENENEFVRLFALGFRALDITEAHDLLEKIEDTLDKEWYAENKVVTVKEFTTNVPDKVRHFFMNMMKYNKFEFAHMMARIFRKLNVYEARGMIKHAQYILDEEEIELPAETIGSVTYAIKDLKNLREAEAFLSNLFFTNRNEFVRFMVYLLKNANVNEARGFLLLIQDAVNQVEEIPVPQWYNVETSYLPWWPKEMQTTESKPETKPSWWQQTQRPSQWSSAEQRPSQFWSAEQRPSQFWSAEQRPAQYQRPQWQNGEQTSQPKPCWSVERPGQLYPAGEKFTKYNPEYKPATRPWWPVERPEVESWLNRPVEKESIEHSEYDNEALTNAPEKLREQVLYLARSDRQGFLKMIVKVFETLNYYEARGLINIVKQFFVKNSVDSVIDAVSVDWKVDEIQTLEEFERFLVNLLNTDRDEFIRFAAFVLRDVNVEDAHRFLFNLERELVKEVEHEIPTFDEHRMEYEITNVPEKIRSWFVALARINKFEFNRLLLTVFKNLNVYEAHGIVDAVKELLVKEYVPATSHHMTINWTIKDITCVRDAEKFLVNLIRANREEFIRFMAYVLRNNNVEEAQHILAHLEESMDHESEISSNTYVPSNEVGDLTEVPQEIRHYFLNLVRTNKIEFARMFTEVLDYLNKYEIRGLLSELKSFLIDEKMHLTHEFGQVNWTIHKIESVAEAKQFLKNLLIANTGEFVRFTAYLLRNTERTYAHGILVNLEYNLVKRPFHPIATSSEVHYNALTSAPEKIKSYFLNLLRNDKNKFIYIVAKNLKTMNLYEAQGLISVVRQLLAKETFEGSQGNMVWTQEDITSIEEAETFLVNLYRYNRTELVKFITFLFKNIPAAEARGVMAVIEEKIFEGISTNTVTITSEYEAREYLIRMLRVNRREFVRLMTQVLKSLDITEAHGILGNVNNVLTRLVGAAVTAVKNVIGNIAGSTSIELHETPVYEVTNVNDSIVAYLINLARTNKQEFINLVADVLQFLGGDSTVVVSSIEQTLKQNPTIEITKVITISPKAPLKI